MRWVESVLAKEPRVAVFDCDGTLWSGDAGYEFMRWSLDRGLVSRQASDWLAARYREYTAGTVDEATICGEMVQVYAGLREAELRQAAKRFFHEVVEPHIFPELLELVERLGSRGTELWAVSSTNNWVVEAGVVERFGIPAHRVLAATVRIESGIVTDSLIAVPTDEAKAEALRRVRVAQPDAVFGNSIHDLAMLLLAGHPFPVNPTQELEEYAEAAGWTIFHPAKAAIVRS